VDVAGAKERMSIKSIPSFQIFINGGMVDEYAAGKSLPAVPKELALLVDM